MESISIFAFILSASSYSAVLLYLSFFAVFYTSYISVDKNIDKIQRYFANPDNSIFFTITNIVLSCCIGLVSYLRKRLALLIFIPSTFIVFVNIAWVPVMIHSIYTCLNTLADMNRSTQCLRSKNYSDNMFSSFFDFGNQSPEILALCFILFYCAICHCHYKMLSISVSILGLSSQYGRWCNFLTHLRRFLYFPLVIVALNNVTRCIDAITKCFSPDPREWGAEKVAGLSVILLSSYTYAVSSKLLQIAQHDIMPILLIDKCANTIRQYGFRPKEAK